MGVLGLTGTVIDKPVGVTRIGGVRSLRSGKIIEARGYVSRSDVPSAGLESRARFPRASRLVV